MLGTSGHRPLWEQPDEFADIMTDIVVSETAPNNFPRGVAAGTHSTGTPTGHTYWTHQGQACWSKRDRAPAGVSASTGAPGSTGARGKRA